MNGSNHVSRRQHGASSILVAIVALTLAFSAVLSPAVASAQNSPEAAANALLDRLAAKDFAAMGDLICAEKRDAALGTLDLASTLAAALPAGVDAQALIDGLTINVTDRTVSLVEQEAERASVSIKATLSVALSDEAARILAAELLAAMGTEVTDDMIDLFLPQIQAGLDQAQVIETDSEVILEDGRWLVCDDFGTAGEPVDSSGVNICGLATLEEINAIGPVAFSEGSEQVEGSCSWFAAAEDGNAILDVSLDGTSADGWDFANMGVDVTEVAGRQAYILSDGALAIDVNGSGDGRVLVVRIIDDSASPEALNAAAAAVAELVVPRFAEASP